MNIFEQASRERVCFNWHGTIMVEDLWMLNLESLDSIHKELTQKRKANEGESLLDRPVQDETLELKIEIVKHVFEVKQTEIAARKAEAIKAQQRQRILQVLADKQDQSLQDKSIEELMEMLNQ
jgi:hypothetical protein